MRARIPREVVKVPPRHREGMSEAHRKMVKTLPCLACGKWGPSDPHHLQRGIPVGERGVGRKASDQYLIPLCRSCHDAAEAGGDDEAWLVARGYDGRDVAKSLWTERGDPEAMLRIITRARQGARLRGNE